ncbi:hypothetical protein A2W13_03810 [Candidatus Woesebacteria bacterium RBG_16_36_11]|uniref:Glycosyltransferase 2-like domain-containing protein n=3 Tax=Candidatus Woeseibacteriota TaxID=1752722 RepID=A0A1F7XAH6_9BACT|nr:MAG: hypothetical protein A2Z67_05875 [Candidatus Woesebacteria bacterium RBG_13_36_22]OGM11355.1 MAG: hypothetical protein A2W13_03810 [Candidatus Woesebacteria bacterium RBG_16_36_11]OGM16925.1 MAG: hypothetical protein A2V55_00925 [Candidatus Woesebacteria bacterium RBG_19FT_COMBO_37_29]
MKRIFLSIVIPAYNYPELLDRLINSIWSSRKINREEIEIIVVDDASKISLKPTVIKYKVRYFRLKKNSGPAKARNLGVDKALGELILFLDSDVVLFPNTLARVVGLYKRNPDLVAATGVWDKKQKSNSFFPNFKALRDWSYWIIERNGGLYYLFSPRIASIKKNIFKGVGGFNTKYKGADVEDIELTYKIAEKYDIKFDEKTKVKHEFGGFGSIARGYFRRSFLWTPLFLKRKKFDPVATTGRETFTGLTAVLAVVGFFLVLITGKFHTIAIFFLLLHFLLVSRFLKFVYSEKGAFFAIRSFFAGIILYLVIYAGSLWYFLSLPFKIVKERFFK